MKIAIFGRFHWKQFEKLGQSKQIVSKQGIKGPDITVNLVWANTYISGYVMHNSVGIVVDNL